MLQSGSMKTNLSQLEQSVALDEHLESNVRVYSRKFPARFVKAQNHLLWDDNGSRYVDLMAGAGALNYGHNNPVLIKGMIEYLGSGELLHSLDLRTPARSRFINELHHNILKPRGMNYKVQFTGPTGSNAVEAALKIARRSTGRSAIIAFTNGFHGMTLGALATTGNGKKRRGAGTALGNVHRMPFCNYLGENVSTIDFLERMLLDPGSGMEKPAAVIVEVIQGEGGINAASTGWLQALAELLKREQILLIVDDIQMGCGRSGRFFSFEEADIDPDIVCLSKSLSGSGQPLAMVLLKKELDCQSPGEHTGTFRGNNLAFVTAARCLDFWQDETFLSLLKTNIATLNDLVEAINGHFQGQLVLPLGRGLARGLKTPSSSFAETVQAYAFQHGVIVETCGPKNDVVKILPPLTIDTQDLHASMDIIFDGMRSAQSQFAAQLAVAVAV